MKLIKITEDNYIIVDNSEIKEGDYYLFTWGGEQEIQRFFKEQYADRENHKHLYDTACKKITHSTQPLELLSENGLSGMGFSKVRPLNIFEIKELIGEVDVEEKMISPYPLNTQNDVDWQNGYIKGYTQALEDNKEKKYTEEDLRKALSQAFMASQEDYQITSDEIIKFLQPKTEWEVEFVNGKIKLK
jgi:hypothetical protein